MINTDPKHFHTYDNKGNMTCCSLEEKIYQNAGASDLINQQHCCDASKEQEAKPHDHDKGKGDNHHDHDHNHGTESWLKPYIAVSISFLLLIIGLVLDHFITPSFFTGYLRSGWYLTAYLPVALPVLNDAVKAIRKGEFFTEFSLMILATIGAFFIQEYPEGVAVMLFYTIGELFQAAAVNKAKRHIKALLDIRPDNVTVIRNKPMEVKPEDVHINEIIQVKTGEKVALDGILLSEYGSFNTAALTGESIPNDLVKGATVLAGMLSLNNVIEIKVNKRFADSSLARILDMVQHANTRKAHTELFIRKFSKIYTPLVVLAALLVLLLPYFFVQHYLFSEWLYRSLIFLVISCPCALVISIPLGYFGGIGAASRNGILLKGSAYLDLLTKVTTIAMDKTGTLTKGIFSVQEVKPVLKTKEELIHIVAAVEAHSTHPIAKAIVAHTGKEIKYKCSDIEEIPGYGLKAIVNNNHVMVGNTRLLKKFNISFPAEIENIITTTVVATINNEYAGYITIADEIKTDSKAAIHDMHRLNIQTIMLSGDKQTVVDEVAKELGIKNAFGNLLPENKVQKIEEFKMNPDGVLAFVGDGINDAPVLAVSDIGIAMGGLGSDVAIETADVVIQTDQPSKIITAIKIGKMTKSIVWQNIFFAFGAKLIVLILGAGGVATMWEAVFADVGVALLAILNAMRIQAKVK